MNFDIKEKKKKKDYTYEKLSPCCVYFVKLTGYSEKFYKIGITKHHPLKRLEKVPYKVSVLGCIFTNRFRARIAEHILHKVHSKFSYTPKIGFSGHSECFSILINSEIKKYADNQDEYTKGYKWI